MRTVTRRALLLSVACSATLATNLDAQSGTPLPPRLSATSQASIRALVDSLRSERLPASALIDKAAEGALKGADDRRIIDAVRALAQRLRTSRTLLGATASDDELLASASAIFAGVPDASIARLARAHRTRHERDVRDGRGSLSAALSIVAELASASVPPDLALSSVDALLTRGARDTDLSAFRNAVDRELRGGVAPREATNTGLQRTLRELGRVPPDAPGM